MQQRVTLRLAHNLQLVTVRWFSRETKCSATAVWLSTAVEFISYLYTHTHTHTHTHSGLGPALGRPELPLLSVVGEGARFRHPRGGEVRWGEVRWGEVRWGEVRWGEVRWGEMREGSLKVWWHTHARTNAHKLPRRRRGNNSPVQFFFFVRTVITVITLWITYCQSM